MKFKDVFKSLRIRNGLTQDELANVLGSSRSTISMYERGERKPDIHTLEEIADYFNVDMNYLSGKEDDGEHYYNNLQTRQIAQEIFENKELRLLFDASRDAKPEDLKAVHDLLLYLKRKEKK